MGNFKIPSSEKEYFELLNNLENQLTADNAKEVDEILSLIFKIKPVRLKWFILKSKVLKLLGQDISDINKVMFEKYIRSYENDNLEEIINYLIENCAENDFVEKQRLMYHKNINRMFSGKSDKDSESFVCDIMNKQYVQMKEFLTESISENDLLDIINYSIIRNDFVVFAIFYQLYQKEFNKTICGYDWFDTIFNYSYFIESLKREKTFIIIEESYNEMICQAVTKVLNMLGHKVYYIKKSQIIEVDSKINMSDTVGISFENMETNEHCEVVYPIEIVFQGRSIGNNTEYIVEYINCNLIDNGFSIVMCSGTYMDNLCQKNSMRKTLQRLYPFQAEYFETNMTFGWSGDYLSYVGETCDVDYHELLNQKPECDYSIVVPARNSADSLRYTLKTCMDLRYQGSYEIIVCDNSTKGNNAIKELIDELNDCRIHYIHPPIELSLTKNFEYAFLHAKGKFIFSIGSDDGVLPWALDIMDALLKECPDQKILLWDRGFYAWPGFNKGQQNQFVIPSKYTKNNVNANFMSSDYYRSYIGNDPQNMYLLPSFYINSGFRREYMKTLLEKTGRLWDGACQDIYMGALNVFINDVILYIKYPLTIAGMTGRSIGAISLNPDENISVFCKNRKNAGIWSAFDLGTGAIWCLTKEERYIGRVSSDIYALYASCMRILAIGLINKEQFNKLFDFEKMYEKQMSLLNKSDILYEEKLSQFKSSAAKIGKKFLEDFKKKYEKLSYTPVFIGESKCISEENYPRTYKTGFNDGGGLILDASEFGVSDVNGAVKLFEKLTGL